MTKKFFLLFSICFIFIFMIKINVRADEYKTLPKEYYQINVGNDNMLEEDGLELISGNVDWDKEGSYILTYSDYGDILYKKEIIILLNTNNQYMIESIDKAEISFSDIDNLVDIFYLNDNSCFVISNYQIEDPTSYDQEKICVTYYENNICKWIYTYNKYSRYVSGLIVNGNLLITGLVYNHDNDSINTIVLFEITKDRQIIKSREIISNLSCNSHGIYYYNNFIFLITSTSGNTKDYQNIKDNNNYELVILRLSYDSFKVLSGKVESEMTDYIVMDTSFYNGRITINLSLKNNKIIDGMEYTNVIVEYNDNLIDVNKYYYSLKNKDYLGYKVLEKDICFYSIDHLVNDKCVKIQFLNTGVYNKNILLDRQNLYNINDIEVISIKNNTMYICLKYHTLTDDYFLGYAKINSENGVNYYTITPNNIRIFKSENPNYIINSYIKGNKIYREKVSLTEIFKIINEDDESYSERNNVIVNCVNTKEFSYINNTNYNVFGEYKNIITTTDQFGNKYCFNEKVNINFHTNLKNNETYQTGFEIAFNGLGLLNGEVIKSKYCVNDIGNYLLVIEGAGGQKKTINFEVKDLTISSILREEDNFKINNLNFYNKLYDDPSFIKENINFEYKENDKNIIPIALSILTFGILSFVLVRKKI